MIGIPDPAVLVGQFYGERNREYVLGAPVFSIGSAPENSLPIPDPALSDRELLIERRNGRYLLDVVAPDGRASLNGAPIQRGEPAVLTHGDVISLADLEFRFARGEPAYSRLHVLAGVHRGKVFRVDGPLVSVGRSAECEIQFPDRSVSRHHCRIRLHGREWWIEDAESTNGTVLNGRPVRDPERLQGGDVVQIGLSRFRFVDVPSPPGAATEGDEWN